MPPKKFTVPRQADADDADPAKGKPTPEGWTDEAWLADCLRRKVESDGRRQRAERAQQKKALLHTQDEKLAVLKTSAESTKRNNDLAFLVSCGAAQNNDKAKAWISSHISAILDGENPEPASTTALPSLHHPRRPPPPNPPPLHRRRSRQKLRRTSSKFEVFFPLCPVI